MTAGQQITFEKGQQVKGLYMGTQITGTVRHREFDCLNHRVQRVWVTLSQPVEVYGSLRTGVQMSLDSTGSESENTYLRNA